MRVVRECVSEVPALFYAPLSGNQDDVVKYKDNIFVNEDEADKFQNKLRARLPKKVFLTDCCGRMHCRERAARSTRKR